MDRLTNLCALLQKVKREGLKLRVNGVTEIPGI